MLTVEHKRITWIEAQGLCQVKLYSLSALKRVFQQCPCFCCNLNQAPGQSFHNPWVNEQSAGVGLLLTLACWRTSGSNNDPLLSSHMC